MLVYGIAVCIQTTIEGPNALLRMPLASACSQFERTGKIPLSHADMAALVIAVSAQTPVCGKLW